MKSRILAPIAVTSLLAAIPVTAADWLARAAKGCEVERTSAATCEKNVSLVRTAMAAANAEGNGNGGTRTLDDAAAAVAAYVVLESLFPHQQPDFEVLLAVQLADIPESQAKADALARARGAAERVLNVGNR